MNERSQTAARLSLLPRGRNLVTAGALAAAIALGLHGASIAGANATPAAPQSAIGALPESFADLVAAVKPAVVNISALSAIPASAAGTPQFSMPSVPPGSPLERFFREFHDQMRPMQPGPHGQARSAGSGFVVDPQGLIVTNHHVVKGAREVMVTFHDGRKTEAEVVGFDEKTDLAVLRVAVDEPLTAVSFGDSDATRVGDWVIAVGNPFGLGGSVTAGIVSARGRDIQSGPYDDYLQVDAPINRGNSGGPLFDRSGRVIGVNTAIFSPTGGSVGIGFAIPAKLAGEIVAELADNGQIDRGWLGVQIQPVTDDIAQSLGLAEAKGALVASVLPGGPAENAGLEPGDVIVSFGGEPVDTARDLPRLVASAETGGEIGVGIVRAGSERTIDATIGQMPGEQRLASATGAEPADGSPRLGVTLSPMSDEVRAHLGLDGNEGVVIAGVETGSAAESRGLRAGDVILRVGSDTVDAPEKVAAAVREAAAAERDSVLLLVRRDDGVRYVAVPLS